MKLFQALINLLNKFKSTQTKSALNGKEINLTGDNTIIKSNNFNVDKDGNMSCNNAEVQNASIVGGNLKMWGNNTLDGVRVFRDSSQNTQYMAYMVSNSIGVNEGDHNAAMLPTVISVGNSSMHEDYITTPVLNQTSLASMKKNFELFNGALSIIKNIDIYKYNLKFEKDTDKKHIGFVIGKKYKYSKEVTNKDNTGVEDYSFISLCCKAIQEQQSIIEEQNKTIDKQNKTIEDLLSRVEKLEQKAGEA